jgi:hypothetical protein
MADSKSGGQRTKPPSLLACIGCRKSHLRCSGVRPACSRCIERGHECVWTASKRGYRQSSMGGAASQVSSKFSPTSLSRPSDDGGSPINALSIPGLELAKVFDETPRPALTTAVLPQEASDLIDVYYKSFHPAHPFLIPKKLYTQRPSLLPESLRAVLRFVASHYTPYANRRSLRNAASSIFSADDDLFKVQGLLLYAMANSACSENEVAGQSLQLAIQLALRIGLNKSSFSVPGHDGSALQESCRRTWWFLYIINGIVATISPADQRFAFTLHAVDCDVPLPASCSAYDSGNFPSSTRCLDHLLDASFFGDEYSYSSFAYAISATHLLGKILALPPLSFSASDSEVEAMDASIASWHLSLPRSKRFEAICGLSGDTDEMLFVAHSIISWCSILLHRPRSILVFIKSHYATTCTPSEAITSPSVQHASHTTKAMVAANTIASLASLPRSVEYGSPMFMCMLTTAATVHLPAYAVAESEQTRGAIKERLKVSIAALARISEIWPRASQAKQQVSAFANDVLRQSGDLSDETSHLGKDAPISDSIYDAVPGFLEMNDSTLWNETWMESLLNSTKDEELSFLQ